MTAVLAFLRRWWVPLAVALASLVGSLVLWRVAYNSGYEACQEAAAEARDAALAQAGKEFRRQLAERDAALEAAQGRVIEVVKWRTRVETRYEEAVREDPDCAAWAAAPVACPLGVQVAPGAGDRPGVPADPGQPDG